MAKIYIECLDRRVRMRKLGNAVLKALGQVSKFKVELVFHDGESMSNLNRNTRGVDGITDVLSYPSLDGIRGKILYPEDCQTELEGNYIFLGSIVLCDEKIKQQAIEFGHSEKAEREYLVIHGLMHLFGYDHMTEEDKKEMRSFEKAALAIYHEKENKKIQKRAEKEKKKEERKDK